MSDRDPMTIAREVLDLAHEDETVTVCSVPDNKVAALARAVIRMDELAGKLEREAEKEREKPNRDYFDYGWDDACTVAAHRIRSTLKGETA